jgi:hypothetical protein
MHRLNKNYFKRTSPLLLEIKPEETSLAHFYLEGWGAVLGLI